MKLQKDLNEKDRELAELISRFIPLEHSLPQMHDQSDYIGICD